MLLAGGFVLIAQVCRASVAPSRSCPEPWAQLPGKPAARPAFVLGARASPRRPGEQGHRDRRATIAWGVQGTLSIVNFGGCDPDELVQKATAKAAAMGMKPIKPGRGKNSVREHAHAPT